MAATSSGFSRLLAKTKPVADVLAFCPDCDDCRAGPVSPRFL